MNHIVIAFDRLRRASLKLSLAKCGFAQEKLHHLGHIISTTGIEADLCKVEKIRNLVPPKEHKGVNSLLCLTNYYKKFISGYSTICAPLFELLKKDAKFEWTEKYQKSLDKLTDILTTAPILAFPDMNKTSVLTFDALAVRSVKY